MWDEIARAALRRLDRAYDARRRMARHALRYRGYSRADADALREYRDCALTNARRVVALESAIARALTHLDAGDLGAARRALGGGDGDAP